MIRNALDTLVNEEKEERETCNKSNKNVEKIWQNE